MRHWINLVEGSAEDRLEQYLRGNFYHGTARTKLGFHQTAPAYFTQNKALAVEYAEDDSEVEGAAPYLLHVRLHCTKPMVMDHVTMQDLHIDFEHGDLVRDLLAQGYDCALGDIGADEICVLDPSKIEVIEEIRLREPDGPSSRGTFGELHSVGSFM